MIDSKLKQFFPFIRADVQPSALLLGKEKYMKKQNKMTTKQKSKKVHRHKWRLEESECPKCGYAVYQYCFGCDGMREVPLNSPKRK